jgi:hypothetical protein
MMAKQKQGSYKRRQWDGKSEGMRFSSTATELTENIRTAKEGGWSKRFKPAIKKGP